MGAWRSLLRSRQAQPFWNTGVETQLRFLGLSAWSRVPRGRVGRVMFCKLTLSQGLGACLAQTDAETGSRGEGIPQLLGAWYRLPWAVIIVREHLSWWKIQLRPTFSPSETVVSERRYLVRLVWKSQQRVTKTRLPEPHLVTYMRTELIQNAPREERPCFTFTFTVTRGTSSFIWFCWCGVLVVSGRLAANFRQPGLWSARSGEHTNSER